MTIDEKIKQAAETQSERSVRDFGQLSDTLVVSRINYERGARMVKSEMLADMQKLVDALEYCAENADPDDEAALAQKFLCMRGACRIALAEFNAKYNKGEK